MTQESPTSPESPRSAPQCHHCGYDLRGLPLPSESCPECGEKIDHYKGERQKAWRAIDRRTRVGVAIGGAFLIGAGAAYCFQGTFTPLAWWLATFGGGIVVSAMVLWVMDGMENL